MDGVISGVKFQLTVLFWCNISDLKAMYPHKYTRKGYILEYIFNHTFIVIYILEHVFWNMIEMVNLTI